MKTNNTITYLVIIAMYSLMALVLEKTILNDNLYRVSFQNQLTENQIQLILGERQKYSGLAYLVSAIIITIKMGLTTIVMYTGAIVTGYKLKLSEAVNLILLAEFVFLLPQIIKTAYFALQANYSLEDVQYFYPLSLLNLFDPTEIDPIWIYPLQTANVFEILYWFALAYGVWRLIKTSFEKAFFLVIKSYLPVLIVWIAFIMFLTVTLSPA